MYRHEAIAIARKFKDESGHQSDVLHAWVVNAILRAANTRVLPRTPVAWRRRSRMDDRMPPWVYWMLETPPNDDDGHQWQPLYAD